MADADPLPPRVRCPHCGRQANVWPPVVLSLGWLLLTVGMGFWPAIGWLLLLYVSLFLASIAWALYEGFRDDRDAWRRHDP